MRTINISQKEVAALRAYKTDLKTMATHFGITVKEMRDVLVNFGFAKPTKSSVDYIINPIFDFTINKVDNLSTAVDNAFATEAEPSVYSAQEDAFLAHN